MKILPSALKHKITKNDIYELLNSTNYIETPLPSGKYGERCMLVGFVARLNYPIEVGIEYPIGADLPLVFHAQKAREPFLSLFKEQHHGQKT